MLTMIALVAEQLPMVNAYLEKDMRKTTKKVLTVFASLILITFGGYLRGHTSVHFSLYNVPNQMK